MRGITTAFAGLVALTAVAVDAAPVVPVKVPAAELGSGALIELVRDGCG